MNVNEPGIQYTTVLNKSVHFSFRSWKESLNCDGQPINETMSLTLEIQVLHDLGQAQKCSAGLNRLMGCKTSPPWSLVLLRQHIYKQRIKNLHRFGFGNQSTQRKPPTSRKSLTNVSHNVVSSTPDSLQLKKNQNTITKNLTNNINMDSTIAKSMMLGIPLVQVGRAIQNIRQRPEYY